MSRNFLLFRCDLFLYHQSIDQTGCWFVGGDCAAWLYMRLLAEAGIVSEQEPLMEDWGWYASVKVSDMNTAVSLSIYPWDYLDHCWLIQLSAKRSFFRRQSNSIIQSAVERVTYGIDRIMKSDRRFESFGWQEQNPFETGIKDPRK